MQLHRCDDVQRYGMAAVAALAGNGSETVANRLVGFRGCQSVVEGLNRSCHAGEPRIAETGGCWAVANLALPGCYARSSAWQTAPIQERPVAQELGRLGGCVAIVQALQTFGMTDCGVAEHGCRAVANLALDCEWNIALLKQAGACVVLPSLANAFPDSAGVARQFLFAVSSLAADAKAARKLAKAGACRAVAAAMKTFSLDAAVQEEACAAVLNLSVHDDGQTGASLGDVGVCGSIVHAMATMQENARVQEATCQATARLATCAAANAKALAAAGACTALALTLSRHPKDRGVQVNFRTCLACACCLLLALRRRI